MSNFNCQSEKPNTMTQCLCFLIVLAVIVPLSILEFKTENGLWWGIVTAYCVNGSIIIWSIITIVETVRGRNSNKDKTWRLYYEWIHFPIEIVFAIIGCLVLYFFHQTWILLLNLLTGSWPIVGARCLENFSN